MSQESTIRFLRLRNREGCDVYIQPYAENRNTGYILLDLDHGDPATLEVMQANGHEPCVVLQTSPGHFQAWIRVSSTPLEPAVATAIARRLARTYQGDLASADWRHLGRLAGLTNQKPRRRLVNGYAPWVRLLHARPGLAARGASLVEAAHCQIPHLPRTVPATAPLHCPLARDPLAAPCTPSTASEIYQAWLNRLRIPQQFPQPIGVSPTSGSPGSCCDREHPWLTVVALLRWGSPGFPRRHADPQDYLRRTLARAVCELADMVFPAPPRRAHCVPDLWSL